MTGLVSTKDAARFPQISDRTLIKCTRLGAVSGIQLGRQYRFPVDELKRILSEGILPRRKPR
jgi:Helix-turn-helix domain